MLVGKVVTVSSQAQCQNVVKIISVMKLCILHLSGNLITSYGFVMVKLLVRVNWVNALVYLDGKMSKPTNHQKILVQLL